jgi:hypothetical protein
MDQGGLSAFRRELETHQVIVELMSSSQLDFAQSKCGFSSSDQQTAGRKIWPMGCRVAKKHLGPSIFTIW